MHVILATFNGGPNILSRNRIFHGYSFNEKIHLVHKMLTVLLNGYCNERRH